MKRKIKVSKILQILLLLTFFLPFYPRGCDNGIDKKVMEKARADSIASADSLRLVDSILKVHPNINLDSFVRKQNFKYHITDSTHHVNTKSCKSDTVKNKISTQEDTLNNAESFDPSNISEYLSKKSLIIKILLKPNGNYSGIGYLLDSIVGLIIYCGIWIGFLLLIIGLIIKNKTFNRNFNVINITALILIYLTDPSYTIIRIGEGKLWGYWVCISAGLIMIIYDTILLWKLRKNKKINSPK